MRSRNVFAAILVTSLLVVGFLGAASVANLAWAGKSVQKSPESARAYVLESKRRARAPRIPLPMGPGYVYYDYPYSYSRGYYPTHIGGYVYYPSFRRAHYPRYGSRCASRRCVAQGSDSRTHASNRRERRACRCL